MQRPDVDVHVSTQTPSREPVLRPRRAERQQRPLALQRATTQLGHHHGDAHVWAYIKLILIVTLTHKLQISNWRLVIK